MYLTYVLQYLNLRVEDKQTFYTYLISQGISGSVATKYQQRFQQDVVKINMTTYQAMGLSLS